MAYFAWFKVILPIFLLFSFATSDDRRTYIIQVDKSAMPDTFSDHHDWYVSALASLSTAEDGKSPFHLYSYKHVLDGFSAVLSESQLNQLEELPFHLATFPESIIHVHTTHTPKFLGLHRHRGIWPASNFGDDVIIGVLDSGIWPESESFHDRNMPPVPKRWRGICESGVEFNTSHCNRKIIGARKFSQGMKQFNLNISSTDDYDSPRDFLGHGTHTSSTAAGSPVRDVDYFSYAKGTAVGMAPKARIAMYKVGFHTGPNDGYKALATDTLAGMDQAIEDGVDIMSLSLGLIETPFFENPIALGAFAAMKKRIFVVCSAGNSGPHAYTILNGAPWITTVGAGTVDREFQAKVTLEDSGVTLIGKSLYPENLFVSRVPLYFGRGNRSKETCDIDSIDHKDVAGKFLFCDESNYQNGVPKFQLKSGTDTDRFGFDTFGAIGAIYSEDDYQIHDAEDFYNPVVVLKTKDGDLVKKYILNSTNVTVSVTFGLTALGSKPAPKVASFSSRGPDKKSPWILKPDILAPGFEILAAWVPNRPSVPIRETDYLLTDYAIISGTSMSCPHVAGIAALLKAKHPDWSSAAIRSAMMTTADITDNRGSQIIDSTTEVAGTPLDFGAGHVNPNKAMDPGLIYDIQAEDYVHYLCALNYTQKEIKIITKTSNFSCELASLDLNYPSFILILNKTNTATSTFKRVLTNVANNSAVYNVVVEARPGMKAVVQPQTIRFRGKHSKAEFNVTVEVKVHTDSINPQSVYGYLKWCEVNGSHVIRSPIVSAIASGKP